MVAHHAALLAMVLATPAFATLDAIPTEGYRGLCQMNEACDASGICGPMPVFGDMILVIDGDGTQVGRTEADLSPADHFSTLQDALPLPHIDSHRREFLVDLPPEGTARRFALYVQRSDVRTGAPILRPRYFVLQCGAS